MVEAIRLVGLQLNNLGPPQSLVKTLSRGQLHGPLERAPSDELKASLIHQIQLVNLLTLTEDELLMLERALLPHVQQFTDSGFRVVLE